MDNKKEIETETENYTEFTQLNNIEKKQNDKEHVSPPFWSENPNILLDKNYIFEFFPIEPMSYNQKLNAITRIIIVLSIIGFAISSSVRLLIISAITIFAIFLFHYYHEKERLKNETKKPILDKIENFDNPAMAYLKESGNAIPTEVFDVPNSSNPFSNVLITDYDYNPNKKPAPPAFNDNVNKDILKQAKQLVSEANPDQPDIADKLFKDLGEQFVFEQSLRPFNSNPNTTIPNDQGSFAEFCYGSMISCKEGNNFACARNLSRHTL